jgi:hypothetical protein
MDRENSENSIEELGTFPNIASSAEEFDHSQAYKRWAFTLYGADKQTNKRAVQKTNGGQNVYYIHCRKRNMSNEWKKTHTRVIYIGKNAKFYKLKKCI